MQPSPVSQQTPEKQVGVPARTIVSWRAIVIGLLLIPVNAYWVIEMEMVHYMDFPTTVSLFFNAIFSLLLLVLVNLLLRRYTPRWALTQAEMLVVYMMVTLASALSGHDMIQVLGSMVTHPAKFATPENKWDKLFMGYLPNWLVIKDMKVLEGFYAGDSSLYTVKNLRGWMTPVLCWSGFMAVLMFMMLCMNTLLRKQWAERERLSYPLITLPIEMTDPSMHLFRNKLMWIGFGIAAAVDIVNGFNVLWPTVPGFAIKAQNVAGALGSRPWNAVNPLHVGFYPFAIGLGALLPVDLSFSCWFFYLFWKMENVVTAAAGLDNIPNFPYPNYQSFGAYIGITVFALYTSRKAFADVLKRALGRESEVDDRDEAVSYRTALLGLLAGAGLLLWFSVAMGMSLWLAVLFLLIYFLLSLGITRMRAELGPPVHDLHFAGPDAVLAAVGGTKNLGTHNLVGLTFFYWFNRAYRGHPMPQQLESYKIAERQKIGYRRVFVAMILAAVIGSLAAFWAYAHCCYTYGATTAKMHGPAAGFGAEPFRRLENWMNNPQPPDVPGTAAMVVGVGFTLLLQALRMRFFWFPFHPVGYAVSGSWSMQFLWLPIFIAWLIKLLLLRYGGLKAFQRAIPFFLGMILGEFVVGSLWAIIGIILGIQTYSFFV